MNRPAKIFLTLSVLLNLLLVGVIAGHAGRFALTETQHRIFDQISDALPSDKQALVEETMERVQTDTKQLREQLKDAHSVAADLLKAEPFDRQAYLDQTQKIRQLRVKMMERMAQAVADIAAQCKPADRAALAEALRRPAR